MTVGELRELLDLFEDNDEVVADTQGGLVKVLDIRGEPIRVWSTQSSASQVAVIDIEYDS